MNSLSIIEGLLKIYWLLQFYGKFINHWRFIEKILIIAILWKVYRSLKVYWKYIDYCKCMESLSIIEGLL